MKRCVLFFLFFFFATLTAREGTNLQELRARVETVEKTLSSNKEMTTKQYIELRKEILAVIHSLGRLEGEIRNQLPLVPPQRKKELEETLSQVEAISAVANDMLRSIDKEKIKSKITSYFKFKVPLYTAATARKGYYQGIEVCQDLGHRIYASLVNIGYNAITYPLYIYWIVWLVLFLSLWPLALYFRKKITHPDRKNSYFNKIQTYIVYVCTGSIGPILFVGAFFAINYATNVFLFETNEIVLFYLVIAFIWISMQAARTFINPKDFRWSFVHIEKSMAKRRSKRISLFLLFLALRLWLNKINHPPELTQYLELTSQILLTVQAFFIIQVTHFRSGIKGLLGFLATICPLLIFFGYGLLADLVLSGTLYTIVIYLVFKMISHTFKICVFYASKKTSLFFWHTKKKEKTSELTIYWIRVAFNFVLFFVAFYFVLLGWGVDRISLNNIVSRAFYGFKVGGHTFSLVNLFSAIVVFILIFLLTKYFQRVLKTHVFPYTHFDAGLRHALQTTAGYIGFTIAIIVSIRTLGLDFSSLLYILGGLSVGIGLGLQPIVTNFISGLIMLIERPIKIGDSIELGGEWGIVKRINVRTTEVENFEKCSVLYPNSQVINAMVKNWTKNDRKRRIEISVGVAYGSDTKLVESVLLSCATEHDGILPDPAPYVIFKDFGDSQLGFTLRCYLKDMSTIFITGNAVKHQIVTALKEKGISIPFPQTDVHFDKNFVDALGKRPTKG